MIIYSKTINAFIARLRGYVRTILEQEMQIKVRRHRFEWNGYLVPFHVVIFERRNVLGLFDHHTYQIGINRHLMLSPNPERIKNILRHELAHFICYLTYGTKVQTHGKEFHQICKRYHWDQSIFGASEDASANTNDYSSIDEKIISKVKKLLSLASSSNGHEAELATVKANELLLKHNLSQIDNHHEEEVYVARVLEAKRNNAKLKTIYEILKTFLVSPVFNYGKGIVYLEVIGDKINVELADYIANFLDCELEKLWKETTKQNTSLKGITAKNSFMRGVATGYVEKIRTTQRKSNNGKELIRLDKALQQKLKLVYSRLSSTASSSTRSCQESEKLGTAAGRSLSIRPGIKSNSLFRFKLTR